MQRKITGFLFERLLGWMGLDGVWPQNLLGDVLRKKKGTKKSKKNIMNKELTPTENNWHITEMESNWHFIFSIYKYLYLFII